MEQVMSKCWKVWQGGREPPAEHEKAFKRLREKVRHAKRILFCFYLLTRVPGTLPKGKVVM